MIGGGGSLGKLVVYLGADTADLVTEFSKAEREAAKFSKSLDSALKVGLAAAAAGLASAAVGIGAAIKQATDRADQLAKAAQKAGVEIEKFSKLNFAASLSDVSTEQLQSAFTQLSKRIVDESSKASQALELLGIKTRDAYGQLKPSDQILTEISGLFAGMSDGATKAALAQELFGKSGVALIPLLNSGADGLRNMTKEAEALGLVVSGGLAESAQQLNDNMTRLGGAFMGFGNQLAENVVPALADLTDGFIKFIADSGLVFIAADGIIGGMKGIVISASLVKQGMDVIARAIIGVFETAAESINFLIRLSDAAAAGMRRTKAQLAANSIEEFRAASNMEGFGSVFEREFAAYTGRVETIWGATADGIRGDISDLVGAFESLRATQGTATGPTAEQLANTQRIQELLQRLANSSKTAAAAEKDRAEAEKLAAEATREAEKAASDFDQIFQRLLDRYRPAEAAQRKYAEEVLRLVAAHTVGKKTTEELTDAVTLLQREFADTAAEAAKAAAALTPFERAVQSLTLEIDAMRNGDSGRLEAEFRRVTESLGPLTVQQENVIRNLLSMKQEAENFAAVLGPISDAMSSALGDFATEVLFNFDNIDGAIKDLGDSMLDTIKRSVAQMLSEIARLNIINPMLNQIFGGSLPTGGLGNIAGTLFGGGTSTGAGAFAGATAGVGRAPVAGFNMGGMLGMAGGAVTGLQGIRSGNPLQGAAGGAMVGMQFGPWGALIGAVVGGLAALIHGVKPPDFRLGGANASIRNREGGFSTVFGNVQAGSRQLSWESLVAPMQQFDSAIADMVNTIGGGQPQIAAITAALARWEVDLKGNAATAENVLGSRFATVLGTFSADVQGFVGTLGTVQERVGRLTDALQIQNIVDTGDLGSSFGEVRTILEEFRATGEDLSVTYQRLMAATGVYESALQVLGESFSGNRQELIQFAADFAEAAGGVQQAASLWQDYFTIFLTEGERLQAAVNAARTNATRELGDIGLDPNTTREAFRAQFEAIRDSLTPEDLVQWLEAGRSLGILFDAEGRLADFRTNEARAAADAVAEAERAAADALERVAEAIQRQTDFTRGLTEQLQDAGLSEFGQRLAGITRRYRDNIATAQELGDATGDTAATMRSMALAARIARNGLAEVRQALIESIQGLVQQLGYQSRAAAQQLGATGAPEGIPFGTFGGGGGVVAQTLEAADSFFEQLRSGFESLEQWLNQSIFGELSGLSPEAQYSEVLQQINAASALIRGGGQGAAEALAGFPELLNRFLQLSRQINASGGNFNADTEFARALAAELLAMRDLITGPGGTGLGGNTGGGGGVTGDTTGSTTPGGGVTTEADRLLLATQLAQQLRELAAITAQPLLDLAQTFGIDLETFFADLGVDLTDMSSANVQQLAAIAAQLGVDLSDIDTALGLGLGDISDAVSPINDALHDIISGLSPELQTALDPLLAALETAETPEERAAARQALVQAILDANPDIANVFAPFFAELDTSTELGDILAQISDVADFTGLSLTAIGDVKRAVEAVSSPVVSAIDALSAANGNGFASVVNAVNAMAAQAAATAAAPDKAAAAANAIPDAPGAKATQSASAQRESAVVVAIERAMERLATRQDDQTRETVGLIGRLGDDIRGGLERSDSRRLAAGGSYGC